MLSLLLACAALLSPGGDDKGEVVPLRDGDFLVGEITSHDESGLEVKRLDNGGVVRLRWGQLAPATESSLKTKFGYRFSASDEVLVEADELTMHDGSKRVGRIRQADEDRIVLQEGASVFTYLRSVLAGPPARVRVAVLEVYSRPDYYAEIAGSYDLATASGNLDLARLLARVPDFEQSMRHYKEAQRLDPQFYPGEIAGALARLEEGKAQQDELDALRDIEIRRARFQWDRALALCAEFPNRFPKSAARDDVAKRVVSIESSKRAFLTGQVVAKYHETLARLLKRTAENRKIPLSAAKASVTGDLKKELVAAVAATLERETGSKELTESFVAQLWSERSKALAAHTTGYYTGTFILGKEKAQEGFTSAPQPSDGAPRSKEEEALLEKQKRLQAGAKKPDSAESWYEKRGTWEREAFLTAWFVESGGVMEVVRRWGIPCHQCGGKGTLEMRTVGGGAPPDSSTCPTCQGVRVVRMLAYR